MTSSKIHPVTTALTRREFVMRSTRSLIGAAAMPAWPDIQPVQGKSVIFLTMAGGMSHLDTFDPKPDRPELMGATRTITTASGGMVGHYLPGASTVMDRVCVIRSMVARETRHSEALTAMRGERGLFTIPHSGNTMDTARSGNPELERLRLADLTNRRFHGAGDLDAAGSGPSSILTESMRRALDPTGETASVRKLYGPGRFAADCLAARRLVQSGMCSVEVVLGGWDTHVDHFTAIAARCAEFDQAFAALIIDLEQRGLLENTLVVVATEFGRSPVIQMEHRQGRDHHPEAFSCLLAGAGVRGGTWLGKTDETGSRVAENPVTFQELNTVITRVLGGSRDFGATHPLAGIFEKRRQV